MEIENLEKSMGYRFRDRSLLERALTHSSYANEKKSEHTADYERLEFLGDAILEMIVCEHVYSGTDLAEGRMTDFKQEYVDNERLSDRILSYGLGIDHTLRVGNVQVKDGRKDVQVKMRADAFEALVAATYLSRGLEEARRVASEVLGLDA